uniref:Helicase HerA central domain-containing protein n=1 Tax=Caldiarchaeum subterraneum TaxID=311458 RepID=A0A7C5Y745_CALS0
MNVDQFVGKKTLIVGEAGSGKTRLLAQLLKELIGISEPSQISVIDLAPEKISGIGGPLSLYGDFSNVKYYRPERVYAPRLMACNAEDVKRYAESNAKLAREQFQKYLRNPTKMLAVNDITIFLHAAEVEELLQYIQKASTFVATAYMGEKLVEDFGTGLSQTEKSKLTKLIEKVDQVIRLNS